MTTVYKSLKNENMVKEEKENHLDKILFVDNEHRSLLERNNILSLEIK